MTEDKNLIEATCPECRGPLTEIRHDEICEYRCLVGHRYSARGVLEAHSEAQEKALWAAVVALEEAANLTKQVASQFPPEVAARLITQGERRLSQAAEIRKVIETLEPFQTE
jgi:two-component system, chemotaxis family, protein-glutamate methylesterase/glutaminase